MNLIKCEKNGIIGKCIKKKPGIHLRKSMLNQVHLIENPAKLTGHGCINMYLRINRSPNYIFIHHHTCTIMFNKLFKLKFR